MIKLWEKETPYFDESIDQKEPYLTPYLLEGEKKGVVIVCPGGGYGHLAPHEGEPISLWLNSIGISSFVLNYRIMPYDKKAILNDVLRAVRVVRHRADEYGIDPEKIGVLGFSAGGHLASCTALRFDKADLSQNDPIDKEESRANAAILCYPVINLSEGYGHVVSGERFLGNDRNEETLRIFSGENSVKDNTPPIFMWHTLDDGAVHVNNSLKLGEALRAKEIPFELHVYPRGRHGLGLAKDEGRPEEWTLSCESWLRSLGF